MADVTELAETPKSPIDAPRKQDAAGEVLPIEQGTQIVWLIVSDTREVLVCTKPSKQSVRDVLTAPELLPGFELPLSQIFAGVSAPEQS